MGHAIRVMVVKARDYYVQLGNISVVSEMHLSAKNCEVLCFKFSAKVKLLEFIQHKWLVTETKMVQKTWFSALRFNTVHIMIHNVRTA